MPSSSSSRRPWGVWESGTVAGWAAGEGDLGGIVEAETSEARARRASIGVRHGGWWWRVDKTTASL